jgi:hypothetical protein
MGGFPCKAVRARLLKMAGNHLCVHRARATTKVLTGLVPVQELSQPRGTEFFGPRGFLSWLKDADARHARDLVVSGLTRLQRDGLWEQRIGDFRREVAYAKVVSKGLAAFWMVCAARVSLRQIIRFCRDCDGRLELF